MKGKWLTLFGAACALIAIGNGTSLRAEEEKKDAEPAYGKGTLPRVVIKSNTTTTPVSTNAMWTLDNDEKRDLCVTGFTMEEWRSMTDKISDITAVDNGGGNYTMNAVDLHVVSTDTTTHHLRISRGADGRAQWWKDGIQFVPSCDPIPATGSYQCRLGSDFCGKWVEQLSGNSTWSILFSSN